MKYLWLMTVAGSILFVSYWCWSRLLPSFISQSMRYKAVVLVLFVYVVPWVWLKGIYNYVIRWFLQVRAPAGNGLPVTVADIVTEEKAYMTPDYRWQLWIVGIWFTVAATLVLVKSILYFKHKRKLLKVSKKCTEGVLAETVERLREELHYHGRLEVYITPYNNTSFTLGVIRPVIFVQEKYAEGQLYFILKHEMTHVARKDLLLKVLMEFAGCLHWYNLLIYGLSAEFDDACEKACDEQVVKLCGHDERMVYSMLLAQSFKNKQDQKKRARRKMPFISSLNGDTRRIMERVNLVMEAREYKNWKKRIAGGLFAGLVALNSLTALAYPDVYHVEDDNAEVAEDTIEGGAFWMGDFIDDGYDNPQFDVIFEDEFIDKNGNISPVSSHTPYVFCIKHDIVSGYYQTHRKDDNGGCVVKTFESTRCTICNTIWIGDLYATMTCVKCPHNTK